MLAIRTTSVTGKLSELVSIPKDKKSTRMKLAGILWFIFIFMGSNHFGQFGKISVYNELTRIRENPDRVWLNMTGPLTWAQIWKSVAACRWLFYLGSVCYWSKTAISACWVLSSATERKGSHSIDVNFKNLKDGKRRPTEIQAPFEKNALFKPLYLSLSPKDHGHARWLYIEK